MAVAFQSVQTDGTNPQASGTRTVTKPTSLAVGDLMIAFASNNSGTGTTFPSGFTSLGIEDNTAGIRVELQYKIADSSDVAASSFEFTTCGVASISRITGHGGASSIVYVDGQQTNSASFSASGLTPRDYDDDVLLMMFPAFANGSSGTIANYAIATSNPSWTQGYNIPGASSNGVGMAYATRPEVTATGNFSANGAGSLGADWAGILIAIAVPFVFSANESVAVSETSKGNISATYADSVSLLEVIQSIIQRWANAIKNSSIFTNQSKNSSVFTNQSKNSSTWTNQDKND